MPLCETLKTKSGVNCGEEKWRLLFWILWYTTCHVSVYSAPLLHVRKFSALCLPKIRSDQISRSVMSDSLLPHELQHASPSPPCPSPTPGVHSDSCPSSQWCHPAISPSVVPFSSCPQSLPASESFPMSQLFAWGGQIPDRSQKLSFPAFFVTWCYVCESHKLIIQGSDWLFFFLIYRL